MANSSEPGKKTLIAVASKLASDPDVPGELFGDVMDAVSGIVASPSPNADPAEKQWHQPGDKGMYMASSPMAIVMFGEAEMHLSEAAHRLMDVYAGIVPDFSSRKKIKESIKKLEGGLDAWHTKYGDDLVMQDTGTDYIGVSAVGEAYLAKRFRVTVGEATGAIGALMRTKFAERRVYLTGDEFPLGRLFITDCRPQVETDPRFSLGYRIPKHPAKDGAAKTRI